MGARRSEPVKYLLVESNGLGALFPEPFEGTPGEIVAVAWGEDLYTGHGRKLPMAGSLSEFADRLGIRPQKSAGGRHHTKFLREFLDKHFPAPPKKDAPKSPGRERTPEELRHDEALKILQAEFGVEAKRGRGALYTMTDKHGKEAQATHKGGGKFEPFVPREGGGTKVLGRNRWAAQQFENRLREIEDDLLLAELEAADAKEAGCSKQA